MTGVLYRATPPISKIPLPRSGSPYRIIHEGYGLTWRRKGRAKGKRGYQGRCWYDSNQL